MTNAGFIGILLLLGLMPVALAARVGENAKTLRERFGRPQAEPAKNTLMWTIEERSGPVMYTVTLNAKGLSIAEGIKPMRSEELPEPLARAFILDQLSAFAGSKSVRTIKPGEKYQFAGEEFQCASGEEIAVDDENGLLVVWNRRGAGVPSVMAVTKEMIAAPKAK